MYVCKYLVVLVQQEGKKREKRVGEKSSNSKPNMVATATIAGAFFGLWVQLYSNGVRKLRPSFHPWEHVLAMGSGIVLANGVVHWEHKLKKDLDKLIKKIQKANKSDF